MGDQRIKMKPYEGMRVSVRGVCIEKGDWTESYRQVGRVCIRDPEIKDEIVAGYVWCINSSAWADIHHHIGDQVEFDALVERYMDSGNRVNWCLKNPGPPRWLTNVASKIPASE